MTHANYRNELLDMSTYTYLSRISCFTLSQKLAHNILTGIQKCTELEHSAPINEAKTEYLLQCEQKAITGHYLDLVTPCKSACLIVLSLILILCSNPRLHQPYSPLTISLSLWNMWICLLAHKHYISYSSIWLDLYLRIIKHSSHSFLHSVLTSSFIDTNIPLCTMS